nr:hypothetical protein Q903MT_gene6613 [Picea sitchensis]
MNTLSLLTSISSSNELIGLGLLLISLLMRGAVHRTNNSQQILFIPNKDAPHPISHLKSKWISS